MLITSTANEKVKFLRALYQDKKLRLSEDAYVCEGVNLVKDIPSEVNVRELWYRESDFQSLSGLIGRQCDTYVLPDKIFDGVADTVTPSGVIAVVEKKKPYTDFSKETRVLLLAELRDAGNVGTILRTAAANGIKTVICADCAEAFSPKSVRASMGGVFYVNVITCSTAEALDLLKGRKIVALDMGGKSIYGYKRTDNVAIAVGNEAHGLPEAVKLSADETVSIPMTDTVESLNAAVSISIAMYLIN